MPDRRVRILCTSMTAGMREVSRIGLKTLDPRWCYALNPAELLQTPEGTVVVDLTHIGRRTGVTERLEKVARQRNLRLVSVHHLARLPPYQAGSG